MPKCGPPKTVSVKPYTRSGPKRRRKRRRARKAPAGRYWVCVNRSGRTCGVHHRTLTGAVTHRKQLDKAARAARARHGGQLNDWDIRSRSGS